MKRLIFLACLLLLIFTTACSKQPNSTTNNISDYYASVLSSCRSVDDAFPIITDVSQDKFGLLELCELDENIMQNYAVSFSAMNNRAYGIAIILPIQGNTDVVADKLTAFVCAQQNAFRDYLPNQYLIAEDAKTEILDSGEVVLVMCENSDVVLQNIKTTLAQNTLR